MSSDSHWASVFFWSLSMAAVHSDYSLWPIQPSKFISGLWQWVWGLEEVLGGAQPCSLEWARPRLLATAVYKHRDVKKRSPQWFQTKFCAKLHQCADKDLHTGTIIGPAKLFQNHFMTDTTLWLCFVQWRWQQQQQKSRGNYSHDKEQWGRASALCLHVGANKSHGHPNTAVWEKNSGGRTKTCLAFFFFFQNYAPAWSLTEGWVGHGLGGHFLPTGSWCNTGVKLLLRLSSFQSKVKVN